MNFVMCKVNNKNVLLNLNTIEQFYEFNNRIIAVVRINDIVTLYETPGFESLEEFYGWLRGI